MRIDQMERDATVVDFTARLLAGLVRTENTAALRQALPEALPWITFLPDEDIDLLLAELVDTARGAVALDNLAPIALLLTQWKHSAEICADPALHAILTREPEGDIGPVPPARGGGVSPKRGDRAAPPPTGVGAPPGRRLGESTTSGSPTPKRQRAGNTSARRQGTCAARSRRSVRPLAPPTAPVVSPSRQHRLKGSLGTGTFKGHPLERWQFEVTGGGCVRYLIDDANRTAWITYAGTGHPKATD
ncbi:hypothetical protein ACFV0O_09755 [Kitasatospora sp. NPDC059577]|uniref:hypothetical protein n=1 Tax=Kitasatospora sp. NPDC059577 TaxID=3346873 RepID=UPI00369F1A90